MQQRRSTVQPYLLMVEIQLEKNQSQDTHHKRAFKDMGVLNFCQVLGVFTKLVFFLPQQLNELGVNE